VLTAARPAARAGYSAAGEALNCDIWSIAVRAAVDLGADKLFCLTVPESQPFALPAWVPVGDAEALLNRLVMQHQSFDDLSATVVPRRCAPRARPAGRAPVAAGPGPASDTDSLRLTHVGMPPAPGRLARSHAETAGV